MEDYDQKILEKILDISTAVENIKELLNYLNVRQNYAIFIKFELKTLFCLSNSNTVLI